MNKASIPVVLSILIVASIIDTSITRISVFTGGLTSTLNIVVFSVLVVIYAIGQFLILHFIKRKLVTSKIASLHAIHKIVSFIQYLLICLFGIIILQMILTSSYNILLLGLILCYYMCFIYCTFGISSKKVLFVD